MKRLLILIGFVFIGLHLGAQNSLSLSTVSGHPGDTVTITLSMTNSDAVTAMQTFVPLGSQLTYLQGSATLTARSNGHQMTATVLRDTLRIYSYSLGLNAFAGNSGALLTFQLVLGNEPGNYSLPLCSSYLSSASGASLAVQTTAGGITILAPKISLSPASIDFGHCPIRSSYTRSVTIRNVGNEPLAISNITYDENTLSSTTSNITIAAGGQQSVTISYLPVTAGTVMLHGLFHSNAKVGDSVLAVAADPYSVNELRPLAVNGYTDSVITIQLRMNNMDSIVALQTAIKLPEALTYIPGSFAVDGNRSQGHIASTGMLGDTLTMLVTSIDNRPLRGGDGVVASFQVRLHGYGYYTLRLLQTVLADSAERNVLSSVYTGSVNIYSPTLNCNSSLDMGSSPVTEIAEAAFLVRNTGNAPLVIERVQFISILGRSDASQYFSVAETFPMTISNNQNATIHVRYSGTDAGSCTATMQIYNNDPRRTLQQVNVSCNRYEPNALYMSTDPTNTVDSTIVSVQLDNYSAITAVQMDVEYPHHYASLNSGDLHLTDRSNGHIVTAARQNDSTLRVLLLSLQNSPFVGNNGSLLDMQLHLLDTTNLAAFPISLHNVMVANASGTNMLTSLDSISYIATRILWDTLYVHDTTVVVEIEQVHDTTTITLWDTAYVDVFIHDTTTLIQYDTTILTQYIHDTTTVTFLDTAYVDVFIHDTTTLIQHDTTILTEFVHDTTFVTLFDTTYIDVFIHDTTFINNYIHDTTTIVQYIHDTTTIVQYVYDTTFIDRFIYDTIYIHDTIVVGINNVEYIDAKVYVSRGQIVVEGAYNEDVTLFDINGRVIERRTRNDRCNQMRATELIEWRTGSSECISFNVPVSGAYIIKIGNHQARKVVVIK